MKKGWVQATPIEGTFVVNIGDVMMNWTNGRYISNLHRVVNRKAKDRMSLPHFANADLRRDHRARSGLDRARL